MRRLQKLSRLSRYLEQFSIEGVACSFVVTQADATTKLNSAVGDQVLLARPEVHQDGNSDNYTQTLSTAIFVLAKDPGAGRTDARMNETYSRLEALSDRILEIIEDACTAGQCDLLSGLDLVSVDVVPEYSLFGGWNGYSIELKFE
ncbi:MAG: hypothetical protein K5651_05220 [Bacteroidales bacterium]|nr:hypothetical protein [Bacteroidales bacterium]